jgi:hypothetical protein
MAGRDDLEGACRKTGKQSEWTHPHCYCDETLFISLNTVRFHVKAVYGKLDVNNRTQAVERVRQLRIL